MKILVGNNTAAHFNLPAFGALAAHVVDTGVDPCYLGRYAWT
jgi:hypothetical protein